MVRPWSHATILQTGTKCKKIVCYMRDPACRWRFVETVKLVSSYAKNLKSPQV